jgi:hypothetical protein
MSDAATSVASPLQRRDAAVDPPLRPTAAPGRHPDVAPGQTSSSRTQSTHADWRSDKLLVMLAMQTAGILHTGIRRSPYKIIKIGELRTTASRLIRSQRDQLQPSRIALAIVCCEQDPLGQSPAQDVSGKRLDDKRRLNVFPRVIESTRQQRQGLSGSVPLHRQAR